MLYYKSSCFLSIDCVGCITQNYVSHILCNKNPILGFEFFLFYIDDVTLWFFLHVEQWNFWLSKEREFVVHVTKEFLLFFFYGFDNATLFWTIKLYFIIMEKKIKYL